jgi:hypothetical protein
MIRRPSNDQHVIPSYHDDEQHVYTGPERRNQDIVINMPDPKTDKPPMPFWVQLAAFVFTLLCSSIGTYLSLHDEQLRLSFKLEQIEKEFKAANEVHNKTHDRIFEQIDRVSVQLQSTEDTMTSIMQQRSKK